ncbi:hypothetical protein VaNZ11_012967 [Volvox africanus]|uniref:Uncharacterized protein n=1 Tax=Volvox africanus TaxID=51714 RepID=A0ABQ5SF20_9CHLO|nr:hypothetical protein VaNZ11_012967 [Volvox africanus]
MHVLKSPIQVYRDLLWESPRPIVWVQSQIVAVMARIFAVVLMPSPLYRFANPWLVIAARAVAPACLLITSWWPALDLFRRRWNTAPGSNGQLVNTSSTTDLQRSDDEYIDFSLRWYPVMDVAFNYIYPTSFFVEAVYGIFSATCILMLGLLTFPGVRLPRGFLLKQQLAKCLLSTVALLAIEWWRHLYVNRSSGTVRSTSDTCNGHGGGLRDVPGCGQKEEATLGVLPGDSSSDVMASGGNSGRVGEDGGVESSALQDGRDAQQQPEEPHGSSHLDQQRRQPGTPRPVRVIRVATRCEGGNGGREAPVADPWVVALARILQRRQHRNTVHGRIQATYRLGPAALQAAAAVAYRSSSTVPPSSSPLPPQGLLQLHARRLPPYTPFHVCFSPDGHRGLPRQGEFAMPPGGSPVQQQQQRTADVLALPGVRLHTDQDTPRRVEGGGGGAAARTQRHALTDHGRQQRLPQHQIQLSQVPNHVPYRGLTMSYSTRLKVDGWEPEQVAPGYQRRIARVLDNAGLQLEAVTLRRGCIEMVIETRAIAGDSLDGEGGTAAAGAAAVTALGVCGGVHSSTDLGAGNSNAPLHGAGDATPQRLEAFDDVLDIGALIRALELPDSGFLEPDMGLAGGVDGGYGIIGGGGDEYSPRSSTAAATDAGVLSSPLTTGFVWTGLPYPYPGQLLPSLSHLPAGISQPDSYRDAVAARGVSGMATTAATARDTRGDCVEGGTWAAAYLRVSDDEVDPGEFQPPTSSRTAYNTFQEVAEEGEEEVLMATADQRFASPASVRSGLAAAAAAASAASLGSALHPKASPRVLPSGLVGLPYVLDIFPRVLLVSTARADSGAMSHVTSQQQEGQCAEQTQQTALHGTQHDVWASETLILAVAWVTWSREGHHDRTVANVNIDAHAPATVPATATALFQSPPTEEHVVSRGASCVVSAVEDASLRESVPPAGEATAAGASVSRSVVRPIFAADIDTAAADTRASTELIPILQPSVAWDAAVAAPASQATEGCKAGISSVAAPVEPRPKTQIMFRFRGELVAVALLEPAGRDAAGIDLPGPPSIPPPSGIAVAAAGGGASSSESGPVGTPLQQRQPHPPFGEEAAVMGVPPMEAAAAEAEEATGGELRQGGSVALGGEAVYSIELGQLLKQLRPGALLVEAHQVQGGIAVEETSVATGGVSADPDADRPDPTAVPILLVDDPRVCAELQTALDNWYGTVDEMDSMSYDMGALLWLQDHLAACAAATAIGDGGGMATLRLRALSARAERLHSHLLVYAEALHWTETQRWLRARQHAVAASVAAAVAMAVERGEGDGQGAATVSSNNGNSRSQMPGGEGGGGGGGASGDDDLGGTEPPATGHLAPLDFASLPPGLRRLLAAAPFAGRALRSVHRLLRLLLVVLGWRSEGEADTAAYMSYTAIFATNMMSVMQVMDVIGFLSVMLRGNGKPSGSGGSTRLPWLDPDKACVLMAASTGAVMGALWLVLPRGTWRHISARAKWPRQVSYTLSKAMVAFLGFPQPPATIRHELGMSIFVLEGVILPAGVLMSPLESVFMGLIRAPLCARMWLLAAGSTFTITTAMARAFALSALNVLTTIVVHIYIRVSYERQCRGAAQRAKAD